MELLTVGKFKASILTQYLKYIILGILGIVALLQLYSITAGDGRLWLSRIHRTYQMTSMERNARFYIGRSGSEFMKFLVDTVPEDGSVVVVPEGVIFRQQSLLQFFLMPRSIPHCGCDENPTQYSPSCIECLRYPNHYIPAIGNFPSLEVMEGWKTFIPYPVDSSLYHGIYVPIDSHPEQSVSQDNQANSLLVALSIDIVVCVAIFFLGYMISDTIIRTLKKNHAIVAGIPIGMGTLTWATFLVSWAGIRITLLTYIAVYAVLISLIMLVRHRYYHSESFPHINLRNFTERMKGLKKHPLFLGLVSITILFSILTIVITVARSYSTTDGIANWAIKGYATALEGTVYAGQNWGAHLITYPQNIHLMIALFRLVDGDILPGSKIVYALITISLFYGCYIALYRRKVPANIALLGVLIFFSAPLVFRHATLGWANAILTTYIVLGAIYWSEGLAEQKTGFLALGGALLSFAAWTRPEGIGFSLAIGFTTLIVTRIKKRQRFAPGWILLWLLIPASYLLFSATSMTTTEIGSSLGNFLTSIITGNLDLSPLSTIFTYALTNFQLISTWGYITWLILLLIVFVILFQRKGSSQFTISIFTAALVSFLSPIAILFIAYGEKSETYIRFLDRQFDRAMMPALLLLFFILIVRVFRSDNRQI